MNFADAVQKAGVKLQRTRAQTVQINIGRRCNQACHHCHVESGPRRTENMTWRTAKRLVDVILASPAVETVDLTGGAPELNPNFRWMVRELREHGFKVIDRCNLTILYERGQEDTAEFLRDHQVHVIASLPCYSKDNVEKQRGQGIFSKSIEALKLLNSLGYGKSSGLPLDLVYNPVGPFLPPDQAKLESNYKKELKELFGIEFNKLYTITNMPIKRFLVDLETSGKLEAYMDLLVTSFNPAVADGVMCKSLMSVAFDGSLYDCDFNQMLDLPLKSSMRTIWDADSFETLKDSKISTAQHCFACTAGAGSSCTGSLETTPTSNKDLQ